jgi:peptidoglycan-associated lipoprotein
VYQFLRHSRSIIVKISRKISLLLLTLIVAACSSTKPPEQAVAPVAPVASQPAPAPMVANIPAQSAVKTVEINPLDDPKSPLAIRSFYFDFDNFQIKSSDQPTISAHAKYIATHNTAKVRLEGNADERGGREYNLALGQKRSEAVKKSLELQGVNTAAIEAVSFGKEKAKDPAHNEAAWAANRRVDIVYVAR